MKSFDSISQLEKYLIQKCKAAVSGTERKVFNAIEKCLVQYYGEFTPEEYIRTKQLYNSLVKTEVKRVGNGFEAEVYFDLSKLNYEQGVMPLRHTPEHGRYGWATWTGENVLDTAMKGSHGGYESGTPIWSKSMAILGDINKLLAQELRELGVPIR